MGSILRVVEDKAEMNNKGKDKKKINGDGAKSCQYMKEEEEVNGCKKCGGG